MYKLFLIKEKRFKRNNLQQIILHIPVHEPARASSKKRLSLYAMWRKLPTSAKSCKQIENLLILIELKGKSEIIDIFITKEKISRC
jgi:hypothetical protein